LNNVVTNQLSASGSFTTRMSDLKADLTGTGINSVPTETAALNLYSSQLTDQFNAQFTALNTLIAQTNNSSQYLTQLFGGTNSQGALSANK
jgi:flagellar hook-associated protein 2